MKPGQLSFATAMVLLGVVVSAVADTKPNPYELIAERNPFRLKDPPPPPDPNATPPPPAAPLATVEVTGIFNMRTKKKVLLEIVPGPGKPAIKPILEEGERVDAIEIVAIDMDNNWVTINNAGTVTNVSLKMPAKSAGGPVAGVPPPVPPPNFGMPYVPPTSAGTPANPFGTPNNAGGRGNVMVSGGTAAPVSVPPAIGTSPFGGGTTAYGAGGYVPHAQPGSFSTPTVAGGDQFKNIPSRINRSTPQSTGTGTPAAQSAPVDPAVQYLNMAIQKQQAEAKGRPFPPLPPIPGLDQ